MYACLERLAPLVTATERESVWLQMGRLARSQERDLRSWLYDEAPAAETSLAGALRAVAASVEDDHGVNVDVVTVGDVPASDRVRPVVEATREAIVFEWAESQQSPIAFTLAGGYLADCLSRDELVDLHRLTIDKAHEIWARRQAARKQRDNSWRLSEEEVRQ